MRLQPHTAEWYDRLATHQQGYYYPWHSQFGAWHGEDVYAAMVHQHVRADVDVLDIACGHGKVALRIAPFCRSVLGYDRTRAWVDLAQQTAHERNLTNATFLYHDSSPVAHAGRARLSGSNASFDLLICSKGPFHWIEDAWRVARPGAVLLMLVPDARPLTPWHAWLPEALRWADAADPHWARSTIEQRLAVSKLALRSWWSFDVPEMFSDPEQLYVSLTWGSTPDERPLFDEVRPVLEHVFAEYGGPEGVELRYRRYLWRAVVPG